MRLSVRHRVLGAFLALCSVFAISGLVWLHALMAPAEAFDDLVKQEQRHDLLVAANLGVQRMVGSLQDHRDGNTAARAEFRSLGAQTEQNFQALKKLTWSAKDTELLQQAHKGFHVFQKQAESLNGGRRTGGPVASPSQLVRPLDTLLSADTSGRWSQWAALAQKQTGMTWLFAACLLICVGVAIALSSVLARSVTRPIERIAKATQPISEGYLSTRIPTFADDEIGQLTDAFNLMMDELEGNFLGVVNSFASFVDARSQWTAGHSHRVTQYALDTAQQLHLDERTMGIIKISGLLHDVGKIIVPTEILDKPGRLTDEEFEIMKQHPAIGHRGLSPIPFLKPMLAGVRHHHERYDGKGYPDGLAGEQIPFLARLLAVADAYDAMTSDRPYRPGMPEDKALRILSEDNGKQWDVEMVEAFMRTRDPNLSHVKQPSDSLDLPVHVEPTTLPRTPAIAKDSA